MRNRVMLVLTGGRSTPAVLGALAVKPERVEFISSVDQPQKAREIRGALGTIPGLSFGDAEQQVNAYDKEGVYQVCLRLSQKYGRERLIINLSAGTKIMALGAYQFALEQGIPAIYVVTNQHRILNLTTSEQIAFPTLDVESYLACYGRSGQPKFDAAKLSASLDSIIALARYFVNVGQPALNVLEQIRRRGQGRGKRTCTAPKYRPDAREIQVWKEIQRVGLLDNVQFASDGTRFTILSNFDFEFLKGTWLEIFVWQQAKQLHADDGAPLFSDVQFSLEIPSDTSDACKEIDVAMVYEGQMIHCSCKTGSSKIWSTSYLDELRSVSSLIGGRFCSRIFITAQHAPEEGTSGYDDYRLFCDQARDRQIVVVTGKNLNAIGAILREEAVKPSYWRV